MENPEVLALLQSLDSISGISGFEGEIGDAIAAHMTAITDEAYADALGNRVFVKKGKNPDLKLMISAHMDEIGYLVHDIRDDGCVVFLPVGLQDPRLIINQVLTIYTSKGKVHGVTGGFKPIHQDKEVGRAAGFADSKIGGGPSSRAETEALGVQIGDMVVNERAGRMLGERIYCGKSVDNRSGCAAMILAMRLLRHVKTEATVYCCATVQEEIGVKGARVAARSIKPDVAICIDVGFAGESDALNPDCSRAYLGKGPGIQLYDWNPDFFLGNITLARMRDALIGAARRQDIPFQLIAELRGGTDAAEISLSGDGVLTGGLAIPERYIHTAVGTVSIDDVRWTAELTAAFVKELKSKL